MTSPTSASCKRSHEPRAHSAKREDARGGAKRPPSLTGGESPQVADLGAAKIDWATTTWEPAKTVAVAAFIHRFLTSVIGAVLGEDVPGMFGYEFGARFYVLSSGTPVHIGRVDWGGELHGGRARFDLSGAGCSQVIDWAIFQNFVENLPAVKLTRVDIAVDCLNGEFTVEDARDWYLAGEFNAGGRMPRHSTPGDWLGQTVYGRTLEVGRRENGKMLRAYEKGRQLGDPSSSWTRFEVEIRNIDRDIPFDILTESDKYFVGAYRCLEKILAVAGERIATHQKEGEICIQRLTECASVSYGQLLDVLRMKFTAEQIIEQISRPGIPRRLERASLYGFYDASPAAA